MKYKIFYIYGKFRVHSYGSVITSTKKMGLLYNTLEDAIEDMIYALDNDTLSNIPDFIASEYVRMNKLEPIFEFARVEHLREAKQKYPEFFI